MFIFLISRISTILFLIFLTLITKRKYSIPKTVLIEIVAFILTGAVDYIPDLMVGEVIDIICKSLTVVILIGTIYIISEYKDFRAIFTGVICLCYTLPGNVIGYIVYSSTHSSIGGVAVQLAIHLLFLAYCIIYFRARLSKAFDKRDRNWMLLTIAPLLYFIAVGVLARSSADGLVSPSYIIGMVILLVLPFSMLVILSSYSSADKKRERLLEDLHHLGRVSSIIKNTSEQKSAFVSFYRFVMTVILIIVMGSGLYLLYSNLQIDSEIRQAYMNEFPGAGRFYGTPMLQQGGFWVLVSMSVIFVCLALFGLGYRMQRKSEFEIQQKDRQLIYEIMDAFVGFVDAKDAYTAGHSNRVAEYSRLIAQKLDFTEAEILQVYYSGLLHDCGKISIPERILNNPGRLDGEEFEVIKSHTVKGYEILKNLSSIPSASTAARSHHERYDGRGYPDGKRGEEIPLIARIVSIADAFDAMNYSRVYRTHLTRNQILAELKKGKGTQFDPKLVNVLLSLIEEGKVYIYSGEWNEKNESYR